jgi:small subunit ribosomal protein S17
MNKTAQGKPTEGRAKRRHQIGEVVSLRNLSSVIVKVTRTYRHPLYKKIIRKSKRIAAHNEVPDLKLHDTVLLKEVRPISKTKHHTVVKVVKKL